MDIETLSNDLPECCQVAAAAVTSYPNDAQSLILKAFPAAKSVIVLGHRVRSSLEWVWFPFKAELRETTCAADLHAKSGIESVLRRIEGAGCHGMVLAYPGRCGISFKRLATGTRLGQLGSSFLVVHKEWGPWIHLRVLLTDADVRDHQPDARAICKNCGKCIEACPGKALAPGRHDLEACQRYMQSLMKTADASVYTRKCEVCARVCPVGEQPMAVEISTGDLRRP